MNNIEKVELFLNDNKNTTLILPNDMGTSRYVVLVDSDNDFIRFLSKNNIDLLLAKDLIEGYILEDSIPPLDKMRDSFVSDSEELVNVEDLQSPLPNISKYCINLNEKYLSNKSATISGRDNEIHQLVEILSKKNKSNAILVGDAGVGKTAIAEGLAQKIVGQEVPPHMSLMQICSVDISAMVAGTKYRGEFEETKTPQQPPPLALPIRLGP